MMGGDAAPSAVVVDAVGYAGGAVLALCLVPQVAKIIIVRSARDISIAWSVLYLAGLSLSITYLILKDAMAAWLPMVVEVLGCLLIMLLKLFYEHTDSGRRFSHRQQLDVSVRSLGNGAGRSLSLDKSWHGPEASLQQQQQQQQTGTIALDVICESGSDCSTSTAGPAAAAAAIASQEQQDGGGLFGRGWRGLQPVQPLPATQSVHQPLPPV